MDRDSLLGQLHVTFPIYTGGLRGAMIRQAKAGVEAARQDERRTDLEVIFDVKRLYHARILAQRLFRIGNDTLARMEATLDLTESLYKTGSGKVKKTDFLRNKAIVESIRSVVAEIEGQQNTITVTLLMVIGLDMSTPMELVDEEIPFLHLDVDVQAAIDRAYSSNPDMAKVQAGIQAAEAAVKAAQSGHLPKVGLFANTRRLVNSYDAGISTPENKSGWAVGVGVEIPIFDGFRITNEVREARAKLQKLQHQLALLREGLALEIRRTCIDLNKAQQQKKSSLEAFKSAAENRELNARAYQEELVETKDVIEAQMMEALMSSQYEKILYDNVEFHAKLDFVVGLERGQQLPVRK
jgi:outer membrane protein